MEETKGHDVAVFIDFENIYISAREKYGTNPNFEYIMDQCAKYGRVVAARAYADWYRFSRVTNALYANAIEPRYVPNYYGDEDDRSAIKNSADIHLVIDTMGSLFSYPNIRTYVLVTGDRDFIPLVNAIRQHGKRVVVIGVAESTSSHLAQSADEFVFYHQLSDDILPPEQKKEIYDVLVDALNLARERKNACTLATLKLLMKELLGDFDEKDYSDAQGRHFTRFKDFVREAEQRGKVQMLTTGTVTEVFLPGENPLELSAFALPPLEIAKEEKRRAKRRRRTSGKGSASQDS